MSIEAIKSSTSYGENGAPTKPIQNDKNGVRPMLLDKFAPVKNLQNVNLERTPQKDSVYFSDNGKKYNLNNLRYDMDIKVSNGFLGMGKKTITGNIAGKPVDFKLGLASFWGDAIKLSGKINEKPVELKFKENNIEGNLADEDRDLVPHLLMLVNDKALRYTVGLKVFDTSVMAVLIAEFISDLKSSKELSLLKL